MTNKVLTFLFVVFTLFVYNSTVLAQFNAVLHGVVYNETEQKPIAFANIFIKNSATGTTTDVEGRFEITIAAEKQTVIIVSHINYHKEEIIVNDSLFSDSLKIYLQPKAIQLSDVVVSAGLYEQPLNELTKSVDIITSRKIADNMNTSVADALSPVQGISQIWEYHSPIVLRGLHSTRLVVLKDGNVRMGALPGGYFGTELNIYDAKQIEVIKGPGSVMYGSGAISGIINVISNEPFGNNKNSIKLTSGYGSNNNEFLETIKLCHKKEKSGISLSCKFLKTGEMVYGNGETAENSNIQDRDISLNMGYKFNNKHKFVFNASYHFGDFGKPRGFNGPDKKFTEIRVQEEIFHTDLTYIYSPKSIIETINLKLFYDDAYNDFNQSKHSLVTDKLSSTDIIHYKYNYGGGRLFGIINIGKNNKMTLGTDYYAYQLNNETEIINHYDNTNGFAKGWQNAVEQGNGLFINNEWQTGKKIHLSTGIRFDVASVKEGSLNGVVGKVEKRNSFSGNIGGVYSFTENQYFSLNIARSFRMPSNSELFATVINSAGIRKGNPKLQPEYGYNFDLGFRGSAFNSLLKYDVSLFYYIFEDFIVMALSDEEGIDFTFENKKAQISGGESSVSYLVDNFITSLSKLYLNAGASYVYGVDLSTSEPLPLHAIPPFDLSLGADYLHSLNKKWITGYTIKLDASFSAAQNRVPATTDNFGGGSWGYIPSDQHTVFNFSLGLNSNTLPGYPKLRFIVKNIFNTDYQPFGSYIPAMGRNFKIILSFHF